MKSPPNNNSVDDWKQAIEICKELMLLDYEQALKRIASKSLTDSVRSKVSSTLSRMKKEDSILDSKDFQSVLDKINNGVNLIGKVIDSYKITRFIAKGGMSAVYLAENTQPGIKKPVALKILSPYVFSDKSVELFKREQLILSKLEHPNIVSFHHSGKTEDGTNYLVMEYVDGAQTIVDYCKNERLNVNKINKLMIKLAGVFDYAHQNLVIHRDIKPSNILIDKQGNIKVIDFGIGQLTYKSGSTSTQVFTLDSASPEQILGKNVGIQTDIFSLGTVLLQLLLKKPPLPKINVANYDPLDDVKHVTQLLKLSNMSSDLKNIILTATHIDIKQRYSNMSAFAQDLKNLLENKPIIATKDTFIYRSKKFIKRNPLVVFLSSVLFIAVVVGFITINNLLIAKQKEVAKVEATLDLITQVFTIANPLAQPDPNMSLKKALDTFRDEKLDNLILDKDIRINLHNILADVYTSYRLPNQAIEQNEKVLKLYTPEQLLDDERAYKTLLLKGVNLDFLGKKLESSKSLEQTYSKLKLRLPDNYNLRLEFLTNIMISYYNQYYDTDKASNYQKEMLDLINSNLVDDYILVVQAYLILAAKNMHQNTVNYALAENFIKSAVDISKPHIQENLTSYLDSTRELSILYMRQNKNELASQLLTKAIETSIQSHAQNIYLNRLYTTHSTALYRAGKYQQSIEELTKAINIANSIESMHLLYNPLSKRAMYYIRSNKFKEGIADQLALIPVTQISNTNQLNASLFNLARMLYSIDYSDLGSDLMTYTIENMDKDKPNYESMLEQWLIDVGILNLYANKLILANENLKNANQLSTQESASKTLLKYLLDPVVDESVEIKLPEKLTLASNLLYLLKLEQTQTPFQKEAFDSYCKLPQDYKTNKNFAIKEMFLSSCQSLYEKISIQLPATLKLELDTIKKEKTRAHAISKKHIRSAIGEFM